MADSAVLDSAGRRRSPATLPGFHAGRAPRNKGMLYAADPRTVEEIVCVMRHATEDPHGFRLRAMIVMLWRGGLRVHEALALSEHDLDPQRGSVLVRRGKGSRRREVGMDAWGWQNLRPWLSERLELPAGPLFCVIDGPTRGRPWSAAAVRTEFRRHACEAGVRRRFAPHQLRHAHAVELAREGVSLNVIQRQLGHANLGTTSIYLVARQRREVTRLDRDILRQGAVAMPVRETEHPVSHRQPRRAIAEGGDHAGQLVPSDGRCSVTVDAIGPGRGPLHLSRDESRRMNLNNDVVYRCRRLGPLHQRHPGRSGSLVRHHNRLYPAPPYVEFSPLADASETSASSPIQQRRDECSL
jgi:DNA-binding transcriptional MerR regulator